MEASELSLHVFGKKCGLAPRVGVFSEKNADWRHESACFRENMQTSDLSLHVFPKKIETRTASSDFLLGKIVCCKETEKDQTAIPSG